MTGEVIVLPGAELRRAPIPTPPAGFSDPDELVQAAAQIAFLSMCAERLIADFSERRLALRSGVLPKLNDVAQRLSYIAAVVETDASGDLEDIA